ncbi:response regulator [Candidatus Synchoanobacter obligatus]|uniref:Response regulator n=1 Tax=Candidatus Synchoanobacter obligatus TaxID=2919597 RepID=A0ABT1L7F3_9GAMM|nr:response regulator [Candidatus Synchoanobacter obligatus]MCP8352273.1 response regulator [Candidatus Synchoanobacter obligatus]
MLKILYVEDDEIAQEIGKKMFSLFPNITITMATTGYEALNLFSPNTFDLILTDLGLPDISGVELVQAINAQYPECPPVVAITAHLDPSEPPPHGISRIYAKPLTHEIITEIFNNFDRT